MKKFFYLLFFIVFFISCRKHKPSEGLYSGCFNGTYEYNNQNYSRKRIHTVEIKEVGKDFISISSFGKVDYLTLDKGHVYGSFYLVKTPGVTGKGYLDDPIVVIDGQVKKDKGVYSISGTFQSHYYVEIDDTTFSKEEVTGDFTMTEK